MAKIAISLPEKTLQDIENERLAIGETRSEFVRRAIEMYFVHQRRQKDTEQYVQGYLRQPETEAELGWIEGTAQGALQEYPWENEKE